MEELQHREVALFRYGLVRPLLDDRLSPAERGRLAAELAGVEHPAERVKWMLPVGLVGFRC